MYYGLRGEDPPTPNPAGYPEIVPFFPHSYPFIQVLLIPHIRTMDMRLSRRSGEATTLHNALMIYKGG